MIKCPNCGTKNKDKSRYCKKCGSSLKTSKENQYIGLWKRYFQFLACPSSFSKAMLALVSIYIVPSLLALPILLVVGIISMLMRNLWFTYSLTFIINFESFLLFFTIFYYIILFFSKRPLCQLFTALTIISLLFALLSTPPTMAKQCENISDQECIEKAIATQNTSLCNETGNRKVECYSQIALTQKNLELCNKLEENEKIDCKIRVFRELAKNPDCKTKPCSLEKLYSLQEEYNFHLTEQDTWAREALKPKFELTEEEFQLALAYAKNQISDCEALPTLKKECYNAFASSKPDFNYELCDRLGKDYEACYQLAAINLHDYNICDKLPKGKTKHHCYQKTIGCSYIACEKMFDNLSDQRKCITEGTGGKCNENFPLYAPESCDAAYRIVYNPKRNRIIQECYWNIIKKQNGPSIYCERLSETEKDNCYLYTGRRDLNLEDCKKAGTQKEACLEYVTHVLPKNKIEEYINKLDDLVQLNYQLSINAKIPWTDTKIQLKEGNKVSIIAQGTVHFPREYSPNGRADWNGTHPQNTCPTIAPGSLIGKIGDDGKCFFTGEKKEFTSDKNGQLYLGANDSVYGDNKGAWTVSIKVIKENEFKKWLIEKMKN